MNGKIALITGAARGIGEAIARAFVQEGAYVFLTDIDTEAGEAVARNLGTRAMFRRIDVREERDWARVTAETVSSHGRLDVVVNNAGITGLETGLVAHDPENVSLEDWRAVHRTNLDGVFLGCKYAIRAMRPTSRGHHRGRQLTSQRARNQMFEEGDRGRALRIARRCSQKQSRGLGPRLDRPRGAMRSCLIPNGLDVHSSQFVRAAS